MPAVLLPPPPVVATGGAKIQDARAGVDRPAVLVAGMAPYVIVDVNDEWLRACSYGSREQVVGQTLSIIQGPQTEPEVLAELMEGVTARVPIIELVLTNYDAQRRPFRNELTVEPVECGGEPYFLATCTITLLSRRGRRFTLRRAQAAAQPVAESAPPSVIDVPVSYERDFTADFTRLLCVPALVEQILFCLEAPWAAQASLVCREWHRALTGSHAQQYWREQCARFWGVQPRQLRTAQDDGAADWRCMFSHVQLLRQQQGSRTPHSTAEEPLVLANPNADVQAAWEVPLQHHRVALEATADVARDRSVRTQRPLFVARKDRGIRRSIDRPPVRWGVLAQTGAAGESLWTATPRSTAYFEVTVCPPAVRPVPSPQHNHQHVS